MLIALSEIFEVSVSTLLGETIEPSGKRDSVNEIAEKLSAINAILARAEERKRKWVRGCSFWGLAAVICCLAVKITASFRISRLLQSVSYADVGVIGGADGPIAVYVTSSVHVSELLVAALVLFVSVMGIYLSGKRRT